MLFILNPTAGQRKGAKNLAQMLEIFNRADYEVNVYLTGAAGDCRKMVQLRGAEADLIVCCGGDGTFNETVAAIMDEGLDVPVGYIPTGSTNDLAASLGISLDNIQAAKDIVEGHPYWLDLGLFGDRYFSYIASFGAFTKVSYSTPQSLKNLLGHTAYVLSGIAEVTQLKPENVHIELPDGQLIEGPFIFGAISNSTSVGGILTLSPDTVDMSDGKLEIMLIRSPKDVVELSEIISDLQLQNYNSSMITFLSAERMKVTADENMAWTLDGERHDGVSQVDVTCLRHAVQIVLREDEE